MGKGDKKSKRGKITIGSYGVRRLRKKGRKAAILPVNEVKEEKTVQTAEAVVEQKVVKEKVAAKTAKPAAKKSEAKAEKPKKEKKVE